MPDVWDVRLLEGLVEGLRALVEPILPPAADPEEPEAGPRRRGVVEERREDPLWPLPGAAGHAGHGPEGLRVSQADLQGLVAAHGETGEGAVVAVGKRAVAAVHHRDDLLEEDTLEDVLRGLGPGSALRRVRRSGIVAVHDDEERRRPLLGEEPVEDEPRLPLLAPGE